MQINSKQYAQALIESVSGKDEAGVKLAMDNFVKILAQNNDIKLADQIYIQVERILNERQGILEARVISAKPLGKKAEEIKGQIETETGAKKINLENLVDKNILGGMIIKYGDKTMDASLKTRLGELRQHLTK